MLFSHERCWSLSVLCWGEGKDQGLLSPRACFGFQKGWGLGGRVVHPRPLPHMPSVSMTSSLGQDEQDPSPGSGSAHPLLFLSALTLCGCRDGLQRQKSPQAPGRVEDRVICQGGVCSLEAQVGPECRGGRNPAPHLLAGGGDSYPRNPLSP